MIVRDEVRVDCPHAPGPELTAGLVPALEEAVRAGDVSRAIVLARYAAMDLRALMAFSVRQESEIACEHGRVAELLANIDAVAAETAR